MKLILIVFAATLLPLCSGCSNEHAAKQKALDQEAGRKRHQRFEAQREAIDLLVQGQMNEQEFTASKQKFAVKNRGTIFDFLVGKEIAHYPQLADLGDHGYDILDYLPYLKDSASRWMAEQNDGTKFFAFATDIWDFRYDDGIQFPDFLIIAVQNGVIVGYSTFASCPY